MLLTRLLVPGAVVLLAACGQTNDQDAQNVESALGQNNTAAATSAAPAAGFTLDYEKFTLDNGLEVVLQVDRSDPIVAFSTVIHAGSNREVPGRTGFAHFFEHMAFNDSENVPRGWNRKAIPDWGGERNGGTWTDGTIYYEVVPKDAFDKILWIDSDRLGYMINTVTQDALEAEIQVVKNEKRERVDNVAYGYTGEIIKSNLYPPGHPYNWTVIGSLPDLQAATLPDLKAFYDNWYGAANATLAIVGDIDIETTKTKVQQWFGEIRRGPAVEPLPPMPVSLSASKSLYFEDSFARLPQLRMVFPTVEKYHPDEAPLSALASYLGNSKNSPLYQQVVEQQKLAPAVGSFADAMELAGEFVFVVTANAGTDLDAVKAALDTAFRTFEATGISEQDLQRIKAEQETVLYNNLATVLGKANLMAEDNEFAGDPAYAVKAVAEINALTVADVMRVYNLYLAGKPAVITSFVPRGQSELALEGAELATVWIEEVKELSAEESVTRGEEGEFTPTPTVHDRSEPPFGSLPLVKMPEIWMEELAQGIPLLGIENTEIPLVVFDITIDGGATLDALEQKGLTSLLASLMNEGTATRTAAELEQAIGLLGSDIAVFASNEELTIRATSLTRNFEATVALIREILQSPRFEQADFERVKSAVQTSITAREANPTSIASMTLFRLLYGDQHPQGLPVNGTRDTVSGLTLADVQAQHEKLQYMEARMHVAGDISQQRAVTALAALTDSFRPLRTPLRIRPAPPQENTGKVFFVDVPDAKQSVLLLGRMTVPTTHPDTNKIVFTNEKLGGGISGDLAQVLRIEKGYTYGASSFLNTGLAPQPFLLNTSVRANATRDSLTIIRDMLRSYGQDFSAADVELTQQKVIKGDTRAFESLGNKLNTLHMISRFGKSTAYVEEEQQELLAMTLEDYQRTAATWLDESQMTYVIVGDKATQFDAVNQFAGGAVIELDIYGNPE